jgi:excinuclease ABC subunit A
VPCPEKLIIHPEKPLIAGAMYSPGFFPNGYLGKPYNGGNDLLLALGARFGFDPATTPWNELSPEVQSVFLYGDDQPMEVIVHSRSLGTFTRTATFPGFYGWIRDWDVGGTYTRTETCSDCGGSALRPAYASVTLAGYNSYSLSEMPLTELLPVLRAFNSPVIATHLAAASLNTALRRIEFLIRVGLGYLHLNRISATLSAGEAQRVRLAGLLGSGLTALTVLLDEPTRGLHPREIDALLSALFELRDEGNTLIVVEHDLNFMRAADYLVDVGPGPGLAGGQIVAHGTPAQVAQANTLTAAWLRAEKRADPAHTRRAPNAWLTLRGARANNLRGETVRFPLGVLVGICGVSGSGKSTLVIDTLGRALAPHKHSTSVASEPFEPGPHDAIEGAPPRTILVDQVKTGLETPSAFLGLDPLLRTLFAASEEASALGLDEAAFTRGCSACGGRGSLKTELEFLPALYTPCEVCHGSGLRPEAWDVHISGLSLPELYGLPIDRAFELFSGDPALSAPLAAARQVGLGYLVLHQPGHTLSGGEAQRLKIARELCQKAQPASLYILDEPTVGQHLEDVARLNAVLHHLVAAGHSVFVVEHHPHLLAACDWLIELGPGGGPDGGWVIAGGTPEEVAGMDTPTGPYLREVLG